MNLTSHILERALGLPRADTRDLTVERDLRVPMRDGTVLLADRWAPSTGAEGLPTALVRTPYGRGGMVGQLMARPLAERGYQVLMQSVRGTFGSGGAFDPMRRERSDGLDTLAWVVDQPWFGEAIVLYGASYLGYVQWAVADQLPPQVKAMVPIVTESAVSLGALRQEDFSLQMPFSWGIMIDGQESRWALLNHLTLNRKVARALWTLPLKEADVAAIGRHATYVQNILAHDADAPFWSALDHRSRVRDVTVPVSSIGGWYDIFLPGQLRDFEALQDAGRPARLTIGPWTHADRGMLPVTYGETLGFALALARGEQPPDRTAPVRLYVMGAEEWRDFPAWPPAGYEPRRFHLQPDGGLSTEPVSGPAEPDCYHYDPVHPTPMLGGISLFDKAGRVENGKLEARADVLTYTTGVLDADVEVIGEVGAEIWFRSSLPYADVFVRLCDVDARGRSYNICDGLIGLTGADEISRATVRLYPTAYRFRRGHRIRVQVSSGAFPRYNRNLGTGEPRATATTLRAADQQVFHDAAHPSAVILPVRRSA
ncbi:CocE/NonD family hydrolase [Flindersiella endophytica]